ncbi:MAG: helix-turn-helix domain-containing protein [Clostridium sp.]|nr:helix-turn-helix domain-containing protein [Clostridium sp.]
MKTDYSYLLEEYPSTISMDQLYKICHVSKRKAKWLLEHGVIPCKDSGKKTRRFTIKTMDVINFFEMQEAGKLKNLPPPGIFASKKPNRKTNYIKVSPSAFANLLKEQWLLKPDALNTEQASELLGYTPTTVTKWIKTGRLKAVPYQRGYLIPKKWLICYLVETVNDGRTSKSAKHMKLINQCRCIGQ